MRPTFHLTPREGWLNDPLGVTFRDGRADVFYQYVPGSTQWQPGCHWGHVVSSDLAGWEDCGTALSPGEGDDGCWSGCVVSEGVLLYTAVTASDPALGRVRFASAADDSWRRWEKGDVVAEAPAGVGVTMFRDPFVWRDGDAWRMLVGAALDDGSAATLTFVSLDLADWSYDGVFARRHASERDGVATGEMWECPQLVRVGADEFLVVSVWNDGRLEYVAAARGRSRNGRFDAAEWRRLSFGSCHYAATSFRDDEGHAGLMHWLRGVADPTSGWAGALSVPHRLSVEGGRLVASPHPRLSTRRGPARGLTTDDVARALALPSWHCEVLVEVEGGHPVELRWSAGPTADVVMQLSTDGSGGWTVSSPGGHSASVQHAGRTVRVLLDGCLAEVFLGPAGAAAVPLRAVDTAPASAVTVSCRPGDRLRLTAWDLSAPEQH